MKSEIFFFSFLLSGSIATAQDPAPRSVPVELAPIPVAEGVSIQRFADSSLIKQPTGLAITHAGKLLAVQSNTHFRPDDYEGVETDQIFWIQDTDGDGIADQKSVFYQNELVATMDIAVHPESGAIYVATRNEIIRLWDDNNDGVADPDRVERRLVFLETEGNYPHNGISGLTFDDLGNLIFGVGENLGAPYTIIGGRKTKISDQGEGGNIWWAQADGSSLQRFATGFWNPFGVVHAPGGFIFATDNDPSSRPPSRLHFVIYGGDYGYQYRYGRSGQHPFIAWDGELPGTMPMLHGTGEAPCDILYANGALYVASWADRRIERYHLQWDGFGFSTKQEILVRGEGNFRPVAFAASDDGSLYCSDWVKSDYQLHGEGAIWKVTGWASNLYPMPEAEARIPLMKADPTQDIYWTDPRLSPALIRELGEADRDAAAIRAESDPHRRALRLLAARNADPEDLEGISTIGLADSDPTIQLLALKWISDLQLQESRDAVEAMVNNPPTPKLFLAAITALARIDGKEVADKRVQKLIGERLRQSDASSKVRAAAFEVLADRENFLSIDDLRQIYESGDTDLRINVMLTLLTHPKRKEAVAFAKEILENKETLERVTRFAREVSAPVSTSVTNSESRPAPDDLPAWLTYIDAIDTAEKNPVQRSDHGRLVFHRHCASCHQFGGFGKQGGPDLSDINERGRENIVRSIIDPGAEVAPQYEPWQITLADGTEKVGFLYGQKGKTSFFSDISGNEFQANYNEMVERTRIPVSLMPPGLFLQMSDGEISDLLFWLGQK